MTESRGDEFNSDLLDDSPDIEVPENINNRGSQRKNNRTTTSPKRKPPAKRTSTRNTTSAKSSSNTRPSSPRSTVTRTTSPRTTSLPKTKSLRKSKASAKLDPSGLEINANEDEVLSNLPKYKLADERDIIKVSESAVLARSKSPRRTGASQENISPRSSATRSSRSPSRIKVPPPPGTKKAAQKGKAKAKSTGKKVDEFLTDKVGAPIGNTVTGLSDKIKARNAETGVVSVASNVDDALVAIVSDTTKAFGIPNPRNSELPRGSLNLRDSELPKSSGNNRVLEGLRSFVKDQDEKDNQEIKVSRKPKAQKRDEVSEDEELTPEEREEIEPIERDDENFNSGRINDENFNSEGVKEENEEELPSTRGRSGKRAIRRDTNSSRLKSNEESRKSVV